jgi:hypothetical protein
MPLKSYLSCSILGQNHLDLSATSNDNLKRVRKNICLPLWFTLISTLPAIWPDSISPTHLLIHSLAWDPSSRNGDGGEKRRHTPTKKVDPHKRGGDDRVGGKVDYLDPRPCALKGLRGCPCDLGNHIDSVGCTAITKN